MSRRPALHLTVEEPAEEKEAVCVSPNGTFRQDRFAVSQQGFRTDSTTCTDTLRLEDVDFSEEHLGQGCSAVVKRARLRRTGEQLAIKAIHVFDPEKRKQIGKELNALHHSNSPHLVRFYGAFFREGLLQLALEFMDRGSLHDLVKQYGPVPERVLQHMTVQVVKGLQYLHRARHMMHRDIKPSNLLVNSNGDVKVTDFGISAELNGTLADADTFTGTIIYMSPERIMCDRYTYEADIWSLGLSLMEAVTGEFPYRTSYMRRVFPHLNIPSNRPSALPMPPAAVAAAAEAGAINVEEVQKMPQYKSVSNSAKYLGFWEMLTNIQNYPPPVLPPGAFSAEFEDFIAQCLRKEPRERPSAEDLLAHPWLQCDDGRAEIAAWIKEKEAAAAVSSSSSASGPGAASAATRGAGAGASAAAASAGPADITSLLDSALLGLKINTKGGR